MSAHNNHLMNAPLTGEVWTSGMPRPKTGPAATVSASGRHNDDMPDAVVHESDGSGSLQHAIDLHARGPCLDTGGIDNRDLILRRSEPVGQ